MEAATPLLVLLAVFSPRQQALVGALICIGANTLISLALNVQKLAHVRLRREMSGDGDGDGDGHEDTEGQVEGRGDGQSRAEYSDDDHGEGHDDDDDDDDAEAHGPTTEFLRSRLWWTGMGLMVLGEGGNFISYGFAPASLVAPLGAVALLANVFLAPLLLKERFARSDLLGVLLASLGAAGVVAASSGGGGDGGNGGHQGPNAPAALWSALCEREFIIYAAVATLAGCVLAALSATKWGDRYVLVDVGACAVFGGFTVLATKGLSTLISSGINQGNIHAALKSPLSYALIAVLLSTALVQINFLNRALQRFDARKVIPSQFVFFTISAISGSAVLYRDFERAEPARVVGFLAGCATTFAGVFVLTRRKDGEGDGGDVDAGDKRCADGEEDVEHDGGRQDVSPGKRAPSSSALGRHGAGDERQSLLLPLVPATQERRTTNTPGSSALLRPSKPVTTLTTGSVPTYGSLTGLVMTNVSPVDEESGEAGPSTLTPRTPQSRPAQRRPGSTPLAYASGSSQGLGFSTAQGIAAPIVRTPRLSLVGGSATGAGGYLLLATTPTAMASAPGSAPTPHASSSVDRHIGRSPHHPIEPGASASATPARQTLSLSRSASRSRSIPALSGASPTARKVRGVPSHVPESSASSIQAGAGDGSSSRTHPRRGASGSGTGSGCGSEARNIEDEAYADADAGGADGDAAAQDEDVELDMSMYGSSPSPAPGGPRAGAGAGGVPPPAPANANGRAQGRRRTQMLMMVRAGFSRGRERGRDRDAK